MNDLPSTRDQALEIGSKLFFTGGGCPNGHVAPRYTCNNRCRTCTNESVTRRKATDPEAFREANRKAVAKWAAENPETNKAWRDANRDKINAANDRYKKRNPEKVLGWLHVRREKDREPSRQAALRWQKKHLPKKLALNRKRQAAKLRATPPWLTPEHLAQMEAMYHEARQLTQSTGIPHHVDHIHPLKGRGLCGLHVPWNLQILTATENLQKNNRLPEAA